MEELAYIHTHTAMSLTEVINRKLYRRVFKLICQQRMEAESAGVLA